jgi:hypothetical protein
MNFKKLLVICLSITLFSGSLLNSMQRTDQDKKRFKDTRAVANAKIGIRLNPDEYATIFGGKRPPVDSFMSSVLWRIAGTGSFLTGLTGIGLFGYQFYKGEFTKTKTAAATGLCTAGFIGLYKSIFG